MAAFDRGYGFGRFLLRARCYVHLRIVRVEDLYELEADACGAACHEEYLGSC